MIRLPAAAAPARSPTTKELLMRSLWMTVTVGLALLALRAWAASPSPAPAPPHATPSPAASAAPALQPGEYPATLTGVRLERTAVVIPCPHPRQQPIEYGAAGLPTRYGEPESLCRGGLDASSWRPGRDVMYQMATDSGRVNATVWVHEPAAGGGR